MDPVSLTFGVVSTADVCARAIKYLRSVQKGASTVDKDLKSLENDIKAVENTMDVLNNLCDAVGSREGGNELLEKKPAARAWKSVKEVLEKCETTIEKIHELFKGIEGTPLPKSVSKFEGLMKSMRKHSKEGHYMKLRTELQSYVANLHMLIAALQAACLWDPDSPSDNASAKRRRFEHLKKRIEQVQPLLEAGPGVHLRGSYEAAQAVASSVSNNEFFDPPEAVSSIYTGRYDLLEQLTGYLFDSCGPEKGPDQHRGQKRFIIYGLGGAGKTQFCCKFAEDNRHRYWGVFWVDGSSEQRVKETYAKISIMLGGEPNDDAARSILSTKSEPWLLIIDNLDKEKFPLKQYLPSGQNGHILITTRNPTFKVHGTVGSRSFDFSDLSGDSAAELLLKAADEPPPWTEVVRQLALDISQALGFLPLALIVAGGTILENVCTLKTYMNHWNKSWDRARQATQKGDESRTLVHHTCDVMYVSLTSQVSEGIGDVILIQDAVELLNVLCFLHRQNIRVDLLVKGAKSITAENEDPAQTSTTWHDAFERLRILLYEKVFSAEDAPHLPQVLRFLDSQAGEERLREALAALRKKSLIMYNTTRDSYSVHPIIHTWVRKRREMNVRTQAICCEAAATLVAQSIPLSPKSSSEVDEDFRRDLLPHLNHIRKCKDDINREYIKDRPPRSWMRFSWLIPTIKPSLNRRQALALAKSSSVYSQCGQFEEAYRLQLTVFEYCKSRLGPRNDKTIKIQLAMAQILWRLGRGREAADLQDSALESCLKLRGPNDRMTLIVMDALGVSRWQQGRYIEAQKLHEDAIRLLKENFGFYDVDTLKATDHLGCVHFKYWRYEEARRCHQIASEGLKKKLGAEHYDTLMAKENMAMSYFELGKDRMHLARGLMNEVVESRRRRLGREHPYTLLGILNLARVKAAQGELEEARDNIRDGLLVAYRNLEPDHMGILAARMYLGETYFKLQLLQDADDELTDVIERQRNLPSAQGGVHPDGLMAMYILAECKGAQDRFSTVSGSAMML